jgi:hypothetical protein
LRAVLRNGPQTRFVATALHLHRSSIHDA